MIQNGIKAGKVEIITRVGMETASLNCGVPFVDGVSFIKPGILAGGEEKTFRERAVRSAAADVEGVFTAVKEHRQNSLNFLLVDLKQSRDITVIDDDNQRFNCYRQVEAGLKVQMFHD